MSAEGFWAAWLGEEPDTGQSDPIDAALNAAADAAEAAYPGVTLDRDRFFAHVAARVPDLQALPRCHLADLWIACAALGGEDPAVTAFEKAFGEGIDRTVRRAYAGPGASDVGQTLRMRLLVPREDRPGALSTYAGRSALSSWLTVVSIRAAARQAKTAGKEAAEGELLLEVETATDPELVAIKVEHADAFRSAFEGAIAALPRDERTALRFHIVEGLSIDRIAALESIHRATAARRISSARASIHRSVRSTLREKLRLSNDELESLFRVARSQLDFSVKRHLRTEV